MSTGYRLERAAVVVVSQADAEKYALTIYGTDQIAEVHGARDGTTRLERGPLFDLLDGETVLLSEYGVRVTVAELRELHR